MTTHQKLAACGLAIATLIATSTAATAQAPPAAPAPRPAAAAPKPAKAAATDAPAEPPQPVLEKSAAVRSALETPRKEPRDFVQAILWLIDLGRPELAKPIAADLAKLNLTDAQRIAIVGEFGSQGMLHLARAKELAPEGAAFAEACMAAASAVANDPQRIAALVKQVSDPSAEVRTAARNDLAATGQIGANAALEALAHEADPQRRAALLSAIELLHPFVNRPLLAMLETNDAALRNDVATLLAKLAVPQAASLLPPDAAAAEKALATAIANYKHGATPFVTDAANQIELWTWNDATKTLTATNVPADEAQIVWIARLADQLARIRPDHPEDQQQALVLRLEASGLTRGNPIAGNPINPALLAQADPHVLSQSLADALKAGYSHAALALVQALGTHGDPSILLTADGKPSPLADALISPDRRVRFAALKAIMALNPAAPYPGSSRVPDTLAWFAGSTGENQAVVAMPTIAVASDLVGQLATLKFNAEPTNRARDAVDLARAMPDLELVLIDMNILLPDVRQAVYELRTSPTTGNIPIALLAADGRLAAAQRLASEHTRVVAIPRLHTPESLAATVEDLKKFAARDAVHADQRVAEAAQAQKWIDMLSTGNRPFYTIRRTAMRGPAPPHPAVETPPPAEEPASEALPAP